MSAQPASRFSSPPESRAFAGDQAPGPPLFSVRGFDMSITRASTTRRPELRSSRLWPIPLAKRRCLV